MDLKHITIRRSGPAVALSLAAHGALLALLVWATVSARVRVVAPEQQRRFASIEVAGAARHARVLLPAAPRPMDIPAPKLFAKFAQPRPLPQAKQVAGRPEATRRDARGKGAAASGIGSDAEDASPAFPVYSPKPPVTDRSLLPASEQKIVVDVKLNELGEVVDEKMVRGLGNRLDQVAMDVVKTWRFQPATLNGKPVASEAEVIFPFNQSYPLSEP